MSMSTRIQRLEEELGVGGRLIVLSRPHGMTDRELERLLEAHGISTRSEDLVVSLKRLGDGCPDPWVMVDGERIDLASPTNSNNQ